MTKHEQCMTCSYFDCELCGGCKLYSNAKLKPASNVDLRLTCDGSVHCKCLTIELDEHCPYYREVAADD